jgi:hypothetical protein
MHAYKTLYLLGRVVMSQKNKGAQHYPMLNPLANPDIKIGILTRKLKIFFGSCPSIRESFGSHPSILLHFIWSP